MTQRRSFRKIVNVASVPNRSPFRYPGGKTWLVPYLRAWLKSLAFRPQLFVEPFLGGGIISLTVGFEQLAEKIAMVELDEDVASVWQVILSDDVNWLMTQIKEFDLTIENVRDELAKLIDSPRQRAFRTILKNRTFHGGILAPGSSLVKEGENGKGIQSRWYAATLCERIMHIASIRNRFAFSHSNGIPFIEQHVGDSEKVFFIDPPYTAGGKGKRAGKRLYQHWELDHQELFDLSAQIAGDFLMTYDNDPEVVAMAKQKGFDTEFVPMKNTHHTEMVELLIGKNLDWARKLLVPISEGSLFE